MLNIQARLVVFVVVVRLFLRNHYLYQHSTSFYFLVWINQRTWPRTVRQSPRWRWSTLREVAGSREPPLSDELASAIASSRSGARPPPAYIWNGWRTAGGWCTTGSWSHGSSEPRPGGRGGSGVPAGRWALQPASEGCASQRPLATSESGGTVAGELQGVGIHKRKGHMKLWTHFICWAKIYLFFFYLIYLRLHSPFWKTSLNSDGSICS